jgi:hypothetical protein
MENALQMASIHTEVWPARPLVTDRGSNLLLPPRLMLSTTPRGD